MYKKADEVLQDVVDSLSAQRDELDLHRKMMQVYESTYSSKEVQAQREQHNIEDREVNLAASIMNSLLGYEEEQRKSWAVQSADGKNPQVAEAMSAKVLEIARLAEANYTGSEAYKSAGVGTRGFAKLSYNPDPLGVPVLWTNMRRHNVIPDMSSTHPTGKDMNFIAVREFFTKARMKALQPKYRNMIDEIHAHTGRWEALPTSIQSNTGASCYRAEGEWNSGGFGEMFFLQQDAKRLVARTEIFYKRYASKHVINWPDGKSELYDPENTEHLTAKMTEEVSGVIVEKAPVHEIYCATYLGPYLISDEPHELPFNDLPIVQFRGYQRDDTNICFGPMFYMLAPQIQINDMEVRIMHLMHTRLTQVKQDAIGDDENGIPLTMDEVQRRILSGEAIIPVKEGGAISVEDHLREIANCDKLRMQAIDNLRNSSGISLSYSGLNDKASGIAQEQASIRSQASLAEFDSNARMSRQHMGHLMMMVARDMIGGDEHAITIPAKNGVGERTVVLNQRRNDGVVDNDLVRTRMQVVLSEYADSQSHRAYQLERLTKAFQSATPGGILQQILEPLILQFSDLPDIEAVLADYYRRSGVGRTEEEKQEIYENQQKAQAEERKILMQAKQVEIMAQQAEAVQKLAKGLAEAAQYGIDGRALMAMMGLQAPEMQQPQQQGMQQPQQDPSIVQGQQAEAEDAMMRQDHMARIRSSLLNPPKQAANK